MKIIGLTGSIAMGKSTVAIMLRRMGIPLFDADRVVHELIKPKGAALPLVQQAFPQMVEDGILDRMAMAQLIFNDVAAKKRLENILHPLVAAARDRFLDHARRQRKRMVILDIPLLFENGLEKICDAVIVVSAPNFVQKARALARPGMSAEKLSLILAQQWPDWKKKRQADYVLHNGLGKAHTWRQLKRLIEDLRYA